MASDEEYARVGAEYGVINYAYGLPDAEREAEYAKFYDLIYSTLLVRRHLESRVSQ